MLRIVAVAAFALLLVSGPAQRSRAAEKEGPKKVSKELQAIAKSNNQFAFDLYGRLGRTTAICSSRPRASRPPWR